MSVLKQEYWSISLSGGKDSTAMAIEWLERHKQDPTTYPLDEVIYCDTGVEFPAMQKHIDKLENIFVANGIKFTRLKNEESFEYLLLEKPVKRKNKKFEGKLGYDWPTSRTRWCTGKLKQQVVRRYFKELDKTYTVIQLIGLAYDEQYRLERKSNQAENMRYPLIEWGWTEEDCLKYCYDKEFDWEGLYDIFDRTGCWCCPLQSLDGLRKLRKHFPELWQKLRDWDKKTSLTFKSDYSMEQLEIRFALEDEWIAQGLPIRPTKEFMTEMRKRFK